MPFPFKNPCCARKISLCLLCFSVLQSPAQSTRVAFYNLENLFYPKNDSLKNDDEFTPDGMRNWSFYRYHQKKQRMATAIISIGNWTAPAIVGLAEVENRKVVEDLIGTATLRKFDYGIVHYESPDRRGIDVAAIYRKDKIDVLHSRPIRVKLPGDPGYRTRDILYIKCRAQQDTLHLLYCHWPSRYGGQKASEPKRIAAALTVKQTTDSIIDSKSKAPVIIAGDLNDEWNNVSVLEHLNAKPPGDSAMAVGLINLVAGKSANSGSHRYHGHWSYLDQIIVSGSLLNGDKPRISKSGAQTCRREFLLEKDEKYPGQKPFRSFIGMRYHGGFSDHLPVYVDILH